MTRSDPGRTVPAISREGGASATHGPASQKSKYATPVSLTVEFITPAPVWDAQAQDVPVLAAHHLQYVGTPNRYRLPGLYELHVWAWRDNPNGTYVDWNPRVSCEGIQ